MFRLLPCSRHVVKYPFDFGGTEIGIYDKAGLASYHIGQVLLLEGVAVLRSASVLPYYGVVNRFGGLRIPYYRGLPLVGNSYRGDVLSVYAYGTYRLGYHCGLRGPDFHRIVLHPTRLGEVLGKFFLRACADSAFAVKYYGP